MAKYSLSIVLYPILSLESSIEDGIEALGCPYNNDYNADCKKFHDEYVDVEKLSESEIKKIRLLDDEARGSLGIVYFARLGNRELAIKTQNVAEDLGPYSPSYRSEICATQKAAMYNLAPQVLAYWKCEDKGLIIMERIMGMSLVEYIRKYCLIENRETIMSVYLRVIRATLRLNWEASIIHGDVTFDNIMIDQEVKFIDFGLSHILRKYRVDEKGLHFAARSFFDIERITYRMTNYHNLYGEGIIEGSLETFINIVKRKLYNEKYMYGIFMQDIFRDFYTMHNRVPSVDEAMTALMTKLDMV